MKRWTPIFIYIVLAFISLLTLSSISPDLFLKQLIFFIIGILVVFLVYKFFDIFVYFSIFLYTFFIFLLIYLIFFGSKTRGVVGWFDLYYFKFQPSQFLPPILLFVFYKIFNTKTQKNIYFFLKIIFIILLPSLLVFIEPDLGSTLLLIVLGFSFLFTIGFNKYYYLSIITIGASFLLISSQFLRPYQKQRILNFINTVAGNSNLDYNTRQALIAVGSGKFYGRGLGFGVQSHLKFLPERQTDFIFASFSEEWGFLGSTILIILYAILILYLLFYSINCKFKLDSSILFSIAVLLFTQIFINIGMNIGLMPITGITLPFFSYGGSSIVSVSMLIGIALHILHIKRFEKKAIVL